MAGYEGLGPLGRMVRHDPQGLVVDKGRNDYHALRAVEHVRLQAGRPAVVSVDAHWEERVVREWRPLRLESFHAAQVVNESADAAGDAPVPFCPCGEPCQEVAKWAVLGSRLWRRLLRPYSPHKLARHVEVVGACEVARQYHHLQLPVPIVGVRLADHPDLGVEVGKARPFRGQGYGDHTAPQQMVDLVVGRRCGNAAGVAEDGELPGRPVYALYRQVGGAQGVVAEVYGPEGERNRQELRQLHAVGGENGIVHDEPVALQDVRIQQVVPQFRHRRPPFSIFSIRT